MKNSYGWQEMITSNSHLILVRIWNEWGGQSIREEIASKVFPDIDFWPSYQPGSGTGYEIPNLLLGPKLTKIRLRPCQTYKVYVSRDLTRPYFFEQKNTSPISFCVPLGFIQVGFSVFSLTQFFWSK